MQPRGKTNRNHIKLLSCDMSRPHRPQRNLRWNELEWCLSLRLLGLYQEQDFIWISCLEIQRGKERLVLPWDCHTLPNVDLGWSYRLWRPNISSNREESDLWLDSWMASNKLQLRWCYRSGLSPCACFGKTRGSKRKDSLVVWNTPHVPRASHLAEWRLEWKRIQLQCCHKVTSTLDGQLRLLL